MTNNYQMTQEAKDAQRLVGKLLPILTQDYKDYYYHYMFNHDHFFCNLMGDKCAFEKLKFIPCSHRDKTTEYQMSQEAKDAQSTIGQLLPFLVKDLENYLKGGTLALDVIRVKLRFIPSHALRQSPFFHLACWNDGVTLEIIHCLLSAGPNMLNVTANSSNDRNYWQYPLHVACGNSHCPSTVIEFLIEGNPSIVTTLMSTNNCPLNMYLRCQLKIDIGVVKMMLANYPEEFAQSTSFDAVHAILRNPSKDSSVLEGLRFMLDTFPSCVNVTGDSHDGTLLHAICEMAEPEPEQVQILLDYGSDPNSDDHKDGYLPIHSLCRNRLMNEAVALKMLAMLIKASPSSVLQLGGQPQLLPIEHAIRNCKRSWKFSEVLIEEEPSCLDVARHAPLHTACRHGSLDTVQNMYELFPEEATVARYVTKHSHPLCPIHAVLLHPDGRAAVKIVEFLFQQDRSNATRAVPSLPTQLVNQLPNHSERYDGQLPLHFALSTCIPEHAHAYSTQDVTMIQLLYDANPEAIMTQDREGRTPVDLALHCVREAGRNTRDIRRRSPYYCPVNDPVIAFLLTQQRYVLLIDNSFVKGPPIHSALCDSKASCGTIKLIVRDNPGSVHAATSKGVYPLHMACQCGKVNIVQYLIEDCNCIAGILDHDGDTPLHYACRSGNYKVIKYFLEKQAALVSERNVNGLLPFDSLVLTTDVTVNHKSLEYLDTCWCLLRTHPETLKPGNGAFIAR